MEYEQFDRRLARECAKAFSQSTGLGCTLSDKTGRAFDEYGYGCESCGMCAAAGVSHDRCQSGYAGKKAFADYARYSPASIRSP